MLLLVRYPREKILLFVLAATVGGTSRYPGPSPSQTRGTSYQFDLETSFVSVPMKPVHRLVVCFLIFIRGGVPTHVVSLERV